MRRSLDGSFSETENPVAMEGQMVITEMLNAFWDSTIARARVTAAD